MLYSRLEGRLLTNGAPGKSHGHTLDILDGPACSAVAQLILQKKPLSVGPTVGREAARIHREWELAGLA